MTLAQAAFVFVVLVFAASMLAVPGSLTSGW
jgi:hypothetical protein